MNLKTIILAAGNGTRLRPYTEIVPKPMLRIGPDLYQESSLQKNKQEQERFISDYNINQKGKPILQFTLEELDLLGLRDVTIVIGYLGNKIKKYFGNKFSNLNIEYVVQKEQKGTAHALLQALLQAESSIKNSSDRILCMMGDNIYPIKYIKECLEYLCSILAQEVENPKEFGILSVKNGYIEEIIEKPEKSISKLANTGLYVFDKKIFGILEKLKKSKRGEYEITDAVNILINELAKKGVEIPYVEAEKGSCFFITYLSDLLGTSTKLAKQPKIKRFMRNSLITKTHVV